MEVLFLPARALVNGECVAYCGLWLDVAWVMLYGFAWVGVAATIYGAWKAATRWL